MKCYFDPEREAHGQCQRCGRFANRYYSKIVEGKFICVACFYDSKPIYDIVVGLIEQGKSTEVCGKCQRPVFYNWPDDEEFKMLISALTWKERSDINSFYSPNSISFSSKCPNYCYYCYDHQIKLLDSSRNIDGYKNDLECRVCGITWTKFIKFGGGE